MESTVSGFCWWLTYLLPEDLIWGFGALGFQGCLSKNTDGSGDFQYLGQRFTWSIWLWGGNWGMIPWFCWHQPWTLLGGYRYSLISWVSQQEEGLDAANDFRELDVTYIYLCVYVYLETMIILAHDSSKQTSHLFPCWIFSRKKWQNGLLWEEHGRATWSLRCSPLLRWPLTFARHTTFTPRPSRCFNPWYPTKKKIQTLRKKVERLFQQILYQKHAVGEGIEKRHTKFGFRVSFKDPSPFWKAPCSNEPFFPCNFCELT